MKVERNRVGNKYTFTPEDEKDEKFLDKVNKKIDELEEENKNLKEFKEKREESMFYFKAQMERAEPKTAKEAEDLQRAKELFEGIYRGELYYLEQENKKLKSDLAYERTMLDNVRAEYKSLQNVIKTLKEEIRFLEECLDNKEKVNKSLREENRKLKDELQEWLNAVGNK